MTTPRQKIAIDIDDVLADNAAGFVAFSNKMWGTTLRVDDYHEHWQELWDVELEEAKARADTFLHSGSIKTYTHSEDALPVLRRLSIDFDLCIVTSRQLHTRNDTLAWIHQHYKGVFSDETIHFAGIWDTDVTKRGLAVTKADIIQRLAAEYLIDDQFKHCQAVAQIGLKSLLFGNYSWNQVGDMPLNMTRVNNWRAVEEYFYGR
jgi:5'(3')-deoxyribonucleotidase